MDLILIPNLAKIKMAPKREDISYSAELNVLSGGLETLLTDWEYPLHGDPSKKSAFFYWIFF